MLKRSHGLVILGLLGGCATWRPQGLAPATVIERNHPAVIRATRTDSSSVLIEAPVVAGDSIRGHTNGRTSAVAIADVAYVSLRRTNGAARGAAVGLGVAAGLITLLAATWD